LVLPSVSCILFHMTHTFDPQNMEQVILDSPQQYIDGYKAGDQLAINFPNKIERVLLAGMGGSWMAAALLRDAGIVTHPMNIHRSYDIPSWVDENTLVIASSFSGNTEETTSAYEAAKLKNVPLMGVSSGGELQERCNADGIPFVKIPANPPTIQPRCATGYSVGIIAAVLNKLGMTVSNTEEVINGLSARLSAYMQTARQKGESLGPQFTKVTPVIYSSNEYKSVARIWKIKCNENAKTPAFWNFFPELNHNEMVGWTLPHGAFHVVILKDGNSHERILKRMDITSQLLKEKGVEVTTVDMEGSNQAEKVLSTLLTGDWFSYKLALELQVDPTPVALVEDFKKLLKK